MYFSLSEQAGQEADLILQVLKMTAVDIPLANGGD